MSRKAKSIKIQWDEPLVLADVADRKAELEAALAKAPKSVAVSVATPDDFLARQLVAAARATTADADTQLEATSPSGDFDAVRYEEPAE